MLTDFLTACGSILLESQCTCHVIPDLLTNSLWTVFSHLAVISTKRILDSASGGICLIGTLTYSFTVLARGVPNGFLRCDTSLLGSAGVARQVSTFERAAETQNTSQCIDDRGVNMLSIRMYRFTTIIYSNFQGTPLPTIGCLRVRRRDYILQ
jgi:hypothetical protein